jgi:glycerol-3-phosphate dehydrogenase
MTLGAFKQPDHPTDVLIVGGGINGVGIARDLAGRGLNVVLVEKDDFAAHTSSASTKLIHGGLRYLEYNEFRLVRKALAEREVLLDAAPHIMWPLQFVLPHEPYLRPTWIIRIGLFLYDHLAKRRRLPGSYSVRLADHVAGAPLNYPDRIGFIYSDGWVDDARLVILNAMAARESGATLLTRCQCVGLTPHNNLWQVRLNANGQEVTLFAKSVINAAGPWADLFLKETRPAMAHQGLRLVKGSHIVVPKRFDHPYAYIFQNEDRRIVFAIPYEHDFTLIGTTDVDYKQDPQNVAISEQEVSYLCDVANHYFKNPITPADVVHTYSGVRPLMDDEHLDAKSVTRDYHFEFTSESPPLLSILGGKITTYRKLAEEAADHLKRFIPMSEDWTQHAPLPGGDMPGADFETFVLTLNAQYPQFPPSLLLRYARAYGTRVYTLLGTRTSVADMGEEVLPTVYAVEIEYWRQHEWAVTATDMLWRRSKLGLHLPKNAVERLDAWLNQHS